MRSGAITELVGESAAGKSHLTLILALAAQHESLSTSPGGAIVISSERVLETSRLVELAKVLRAKHGGPPLKQLLDNIHTSRVSDIEACEHALAYVVPPMLERANMQNSNGDAAEGSATTPIRLLIIDSLTALLRGDTERSSSGLAMRSRHICTIADRLKALAAEFDLAVVVVNQVKDVFGPEPLPPGTQSAYQVDDVLPPMLYATQARHFSGQSPGLLKEAALGIVWANAVNTRIMLSRTGRRRMLTIDDVTRGKRQKLSSNPGTGTPRPDSPAVDEETAAAAALHLALDDSKPSLIRRMHLVYSPVATPGMLDYIIAPSGVHTLPGSYRPVDLGPAIRRRDIRLRAAIEDAKDEDVKEEYLTQPSSQVNDLDVFDDLGELPPEFWEGVEALDGEPVCVGVVD